jgi:magnesium-protoporphyrin O-methyltransferase
MACTCDCEATASHFGGRRADRDRARYERHGPDATTRLLLEQLRPVVHPGDTLLDVGGGIGVLGLELQASGLREVILVEAAPTYFTVAQELFGRSAPATRLRVLPGDFTAITPPPTAEIVTLDRVVCCYPDYARLLQAAASCARGVIGLSFPRDRWYVRLVFRLENLIRRVTGNGFRTFVHPPTAMAAVLTSAGWRRLGQRATLVWSVERWGRADAA